MKPYHMKYSTRAMIEDNLKAVHTSLLIGNLTGWAMILTLCVIGYMAVT